MLVQTVCLSCSKSITVPAVYAGKTGPCPGCREGVVVPAAGREFFAAAADDPAAGPPAEANVFAGLDALVNWQGYPFFHGGCLAGRPDAGPYRVIFTPDRLVFLPYTPRPTALPRDSSGAALAALAVAVPFGFGIGATGAAYLASENDKSAKAHKFRNEDKRFHEWKVEDLAQADPGAFVILPKKTAEVYFRPTQAGWVVLVFRRDNGHEWVIRPQAVEDVRACLDALHLFEPHVTNTVRWDTDGERYVVRERGDGSGIPRPTRAAGLHYPPTPFPFKDSSRGPSPIAVRRPPRHWPDDGPEPA